MDISYYNAEVDKILSDILGNDSFIDQDLPEFVSLVSNTIYQYHTDLPLDKLKVVIQYLMENKYQKHYIYDAHSKFNSALNSAQQPKVPNSPAETGKVDCPDKIQLGCSEDLVSHTHDYGQNEYTEEIYLKRLERICQVKQLPQAEQKSEKWLQQRSECLTATAIAIVLDEDPYKYPAELLIDKCGKGAPFEENENVHHGKKYEQIGNMYYSFRNNVNVGEYGLLQNDKYKFIGASPDGICEKNTGENKLTKLVGRLLEIKFPRLRRINTEGDLDGDICPHYYYVQVQTQLFVTQLDECDFLQCQMEEYDSWEDFLQDSNKSIPSLSKKTNLEKGCLVQLFPRKMVGVGDPKQCLYHSKYIYPPKLHMGPAEIEKWVGDEVLTFNKSEWFKDYVIDRIIYWRLAKIACHLIKVDKPWFQSKIPMLKQFWNYVLFYRKYPNKLTKIMEYVEEVGSKNSALIFERVNKDYLSVNKESRYKPLYQEKSEWRKKYDEKSNKYKSQTKVVKI